MNPDRRDAGSALVMALAITGICTSLMLVMIGYALQAGRDSGRDRQRTVAVNAAEAVVDSAYAGLETAVPTNLPCTWPPSGSLAVNTEPDVVQAAAVIEYTFADGTVGCPTSGVQSNVVSALVRSSATTNAISGTSAAERNMESLVRLTPIYEGFDKAIFADGQLTFNNHATIYGDQGSDGDVYSNGNYTCGQNLDIDGALIVQGSILLQQPCSVAGDVWGRDSVTTTNNSALGGRVLSSRSNVSLSGNTSVQGSVLAGGSITWSGCSVSTTKCSPGVSLPDPVVEPFPILDWNDTTRLAWEAQGYQVVTKNGCNSTDPDRPTTWLLANAHLLTQKTLLRTHCRIAMNNVGEVSLGNDLAIFADGGFVTTNRVIFKSTAGPRHLHWIVPANAPNASPRPCTSTSAPVVSTDQQFGLAATVDMFLYSPCDISFSNNSTNIGQVYGGSKVTIRNRFNLQYRPVPVFGASFGGGTIRSYKLDIAYKREAVG